MLFSQKVAYFLTVSFVIFCFWTKLYGTITSKLELNAKISVFVVCVEAIIYLLLHNLHDITFKQNLDIKQKFGVNASVVTRNNIVCKLARGCCLCYCKSFSLVPDSTECTKFFLPKSAVHYLYHLKSSNTIGQRKTTNTGKYFYPWFTFLT